jgi:hypothetical protein
VAEPQARDTKVRPPCIPNAVHEKRLKKLAAKASKSQASFTIAVVMMKTYFSQVG